jgi:MFS family permease
VLLLFRLWGLRLILGDAGRGCLSGSVLVVVGTVVQGTSVYSASIEQFMGGRFLVGFAVAIASAAGPMYVVEISHPAYRGIMTAFHNIWW